MAIMAFAGQGLENRRGGDRLTLAGTTLIGVACWAEFHQAIDGAAYPRLAGLRLASKPIRPCVIAIFLNATAGAAARQVVSHFTRVIIRSAYIVRFPSAAAQSDLTDEFPVICIVLPTSLRQSPWALISELPA